ncbi:uncharacterized protein AB675_7697 [Cyphellophora attinorum]|uniref:Uncharacterized protein n=1 Tax=Cyphellophora attinorum TaxID=1664694 RepID=A0A0N1P0S9_9EURO|nr:uncharacterized protein AB675_7697 [Phialophora attinorum]KPI40540.1 hypothetical protein AB675_7697 [Phialophora attinorum]
MVSCSNCVASRRASSCARRGRSLACSECRRKNIECDLAVLIKAEEDSVAEQSITSPPAKKRRKAATAPKDSKSFQLQELLSGNLIWAIGIDAGTNYCSASWSTVNAHTGVQSQNVVSKQISFGEEGEKEAPMEATIINNGGVPTLYVGQQVQNFLLSQISRRDQVFSLPKLALLAGSEHAVFGVRNAADSIQGDAYDTAAEISRLHQKAISSFKGLLVQVPRKSYDNYEFACNDPVDVLGGVLAWIWDKIVTDIRDETGYSREDASVILKSAKVAASVPEIWSDAMTDWVRRLWLQAGLHSVNIVSEPKCAAVWLAHERQTSVQANSPDQQRHAVADVRNTITIIVDIGCGTLDLATIQAELEPALKVKSLIRGSGSLRGSYQINVIFKKHLVQIFGDSYNRVVEQLSAGGPRDDDLLLEPFSRGFEKAKRQFDPDMEHDLAIPFDSPDRLPPVPEISSVRGNMLFIKAQRMRDILEKFMQGIRPTLDDHFLRLEAFMKQNKTAKKARIEMQCVGGGSKSRFIREWLQGNAEWARMSKHIPQGSLAALGARLMAEDPELGSQEFSRSGYGSAWAVKYESKKHSNAQKADIIAANAEFPTKHVKNRVFWGFPVGAKLLDPEEPLVVDGFVSIIKEFAVWPIELEMELYRTEDLELSQTDDVDASTPGITKLRPLTMDVAFHQQAFPVDSREGSDVYDIECRGIAKWEGSRMYWIFVVHKTGKFPQNAALDEYEGEDYIWKRVELEEVLEYGALRVSG